MVARPKATLMNVLCRAICRTEFGVAEGVQDLIGSGSLFLDGYEVRKHQLDGAYGKTTGLKGLMLDPTTTALFKWFNLDVIGTLEREMEHPGKRYRRQLKVAGATFLKIFKLKPFASFAFSAVVGGILTILA